jgi:hypothetical protein
MVQKAIAFIVEVESPSKALAAKDQREPIPVIFPHLIVWNLVEPEPPDLPLWTGPQRSAE